MSEPTIDEMLNVMERLQLTWIENRKYSDPEVEQMWCKVRAIRAILELHRDIEKHAENQIKLIREYKEQVELEAIRAFVERVQQQEHNGRVWAAIWQELAAMEKEVK